MYGRAPDSMETVTLLFHKLLGQYPAAKVIKAFETWLQRSTEFPTPADIIGLIKRNGRQPVKESDIIAIRKKEVCDWTRAEGDLVEAWEQQQMEKWTDEDPVKDAATLQENIRLREQVKKLQADNNRAWNEVKRLRVYENITVKVTEDPEMSKVKRTIAEMQKAGAKPEDIDAFATMYGLNNEMLAIA